MTAVDRPDKAALVELLALLHAMRAELDELAVLVETADRDKT